MNDIPTPHPVSRFARSHASLVCLLTLALASVPGITQAAVCDHSPAKLAVRVFAGASGAAAVTGLGLKALGFYTLPHATSGAVMLGSTLAGASAAGTVGIVSGTGAGLGATAAAAMSPVVVTAGAVALVGVAAFEGTCRLKKKRVIP